MGLAAWRDLAMLKDLKENLPIITCGNAIPKE